MNRKTLAILAAVVVLPLVLRPAITITNRRYFG